MASEPTARRERPSRVRVPGLGGPSWQLTILVLLSKAGVVDPIKVLVIGDGMVRERGCG
jgi:hypothetical protein